MIKRLLFGFFILISCNIGQSWQFSHNLYISSIKITKLANKTTTKITIKIFADDFRDALQNHFPKQQFIANKTLCEQHQQITKYISTHFYCTINQKKRTLVLQFCILENGMYHVHFKCTTPKNWSSAKIKADFLMELFPKQSNIISLNYNQEKWLARLQKGQEIIEWKIK